MAKDANIKRTATLLAHVLTKSSMPVPTKLC